MNQSLKSAIGGRKVPGADFHRYVPSRTFIFTGAQRFLNGLFDSAEPPGGPCLPHATKQWKGCQKVEGVHGNKHQSEPTLSAWMDGLPDVKFGIIFALVHLAKRTKTAQTLPSRMHQLRRGKFIIPGKIRGAV